MDGVFILFTFHIYYVCGKAPHPSKAAFENQLHLNINKAVPFGRLPLMQLGNVAFNSLVKKNVTNLFQDSVICDSWWHK